MIEALANLQMRFIGSPREARAKSISKAAIRIFSIIFFIIHSSMPQLIRNDDDLFRDRPLSANEECAVNREYFSLSRRENAFD